MIAAAVLAIGLLLILTGLASARIPGGASFAPPGSSRSGDLPADGGLFAFARWAGSPLRAFLLSPIHPATWYASGAILLGPLVALLGFGLVVGLGSAGLSSLLAAGLGVLLIAIAIEGSRLVARLERWRVFVGVPERPRAHAYKPLRGRIADLLRAEFADESRWRDVLYSAINLPLTLIELVVFLVLWTLALTLVTSPIWFDALGASAAGAPWLVGPLADRDAPASLLRVALGALLLPVAASLSQLGIALHRALVAGLICTSEARELRRQVAELRESRSAVLAVEASELRRIERDLHDGAQQRLVMLTIDLGLASEKIDTDPDAAKRLILEGQAQAREALAEIRSLVRGIAPSILLDRGLVAALESIAGHAPVPISVVSDLAPGERLAPLTERTAYFVASEALANVAKHSGATRAEVRVRREGWQLVVEVWDDGRGGARAEPGGGLAGLASRVAGVDGRFAITSPEGGPTLVRAEIPLAGAATPAG
ncbi:MAG TPA: sensor domain-containing protein [Candidatus Limnocylindrales bacterium]|nr:sensor domain-containing protein [Candidatus Limnocylindrales bacterium]